MSQFCEHRNVSGLAQVRIALIGVGANLLGPNNQLPLETCRKAVAGLGAIPGMSLAGLSRWFRSAPIPPSGQPPYVNAVAALRFETGTAVDPAALLASLMQLEAASGRERGAANAARTLDLDIIGIGDLVRDSPDPILPHPRAHLRAFVLAPLSDVAPDWIHPVLHLSASALLAALPPQDIEPL